MDQLQEVMLWWQEIFQITAIFLSILWFWTKFEKPVWQALSVPLLFLIMYVCYDTLMHWRF